MQTVEDRFMLVRGASPRDAEERLRGQWRRYAEPYLNPHGHLVRWKLEAVTDVYQIAEEVLDPGGTEVYRSSADVAFARSSRGGILAWCEIRRHG